MRHDPSIIGMLARTELRMLLRDPRVIIASLLLPAIAMPLLFLASSWSVRQRQQRLNETTCQYAIQGARSGWARHLIALGSAENQGASTNKQALVNCREVTVSNAPAALSEGRIHVLIMAADQASKQTLSAKTTEEDAGRQVPEGVPVIRLTFRGDREESSTAMQRLSKVLDKANEIERSNLLAQVGLPLPADALRIKSTDLAPSAQVASANIGRGLTLLLLVFVLSGGAIVALDTLAGEKERGSLETLLVSGAGRAEMIAAKLIAVSAVGLSVAVAQVGSAWVFATLKVFKFPMDISVVLSPVKLIALFLLYLPLVALISAIMLLVSARARSYKEAQLKFIPLMVVCLVPALAPLLPSLSLRSMMVFLPVANTALSVREIMAGHFDWTFLALAWFSTAGAVLWTFRLVLKTIADERFVAPATEDGSNARTPALFSRHVLVWFAVIWALLLVTSSYLQKADLRIQLLSNLFVFLLGGVILMIWRYKLPVREALSLHLPHPSAWLAVICGVPGGLLVATGLFRVISYVIPIPEKLLESFSRELIPQGITFAELVFFMAILPGIVEEIAFRGVLLYGLKRRMRPIILALVVGAVFGLYHVALFRFAPTFALGVCLAAITILTRSIFPAMLWHALNNAIGVWAAQQQVALGELNLRYYLLGVAALGAAFWILWRNRARAPVAATPDF